MLGHRSTGISVGSATQLHFPVLFPWSFATITCQCLIFSWRCRSRHLTAVLLWAKIKLYISTFPVKHLMYSSSQTEKKEKVWTGNCDVCTLVIYDNVLAFVGDANQNTGFIRFIQSIFCHFLQIFYIPKYLLSNDLH
jgi:hypothetical protein